MTVKQQILNSLKSGEGEDRRERTSSDIAALIDRPGPSVRRTLSVMENAGLIRVSIPNEGRLVYGLA